jgi:hypothetical protein
MPDKAAPASHPVQSGMPKPPKRAGSSGVVSAAIIWAAHSKTYGRYVAGRLFGVMSCKFAGTVNKETLIVIASSGRLCFTGPMTAGKSEECLLTLQSFQD